MMVPYGLTVDGFERQFGTNHLGHFALTGRLFATLLATADSRVVTVASLAHRSGAMNFDNLMFAGGGYTPVAAYGRSKLANLLFAYELQRRLTAAGSSMVSVAAHPGVAATNLGDHFFERWYLAPLKPVMKLALASSADGARSTLRAATDPGVRGGEYFGPCGLGGQRGAPDVAQSNAASRNEADAARLWQCSEELTGVSF
jgi:NAD(P)-dependent dehydrogenase (short-subunit alcohol dehydrogenase family)